jgi:pimeloyl-ACP methyl ester carboxylesterase
MGSASIAFAMGENPDLADAAVLDSCYSRFPSAVSGWWRFLGGRVLAVILWPCILIAGPFAGLNPFRIDVAKSLKNIPAGKVLITHGNADDLALPCEAIRNAQVCGGEDNIVWLEGCGHSEGRWVRPEEFLKAVRNFLESRHMVQGPPES